MSDEYQLAAVVEIGGLSATGSVEKLSFTLPTFPPSVNRLYLINHNQRRVRLSDEALLWRTRVTPCILPCRMPDDWLLKLTLEYHSPNWYCKNGKLRKVDHANYEKLLVDTLFSKWDRDDSYLIEIISRKRRGDWDRIIVILERSEFT